MNIDFINKVHVSELKTDGNQAIAFIRYDDEHLVIETGEMCISYYGIPPLDKPGSKNTYHPTDSSRSYIKIALNSHTQQLQKIMEDADNFFGSDAFKSKQFGIKHQHKYEYLPIIKKPNNNDDDENPNNNKPDYIKILFRTNPTKDKIFTVVKKNDIIMDADTVTKMTQYVKFRSNVKLTIHFFKLWANKQANYNAKKLYGIGLKMIEINVVNDNIKINPLSVYDCATLKKIYRQYMDEKNEVKNKKILIDI